MTIAPTSGFREYNWIVDPTPGNGTHTTIQSAINAATSGQTIFIRAGTYTENLTIKGSVDLCGAASSGFSEDGGTRTNIVGKVTATSSNNCTCSGLTFQTNGDNAISTDAAIMYFENCNFLSTGGNAVFSNTSSGRFLLRNCTGSILANGGAFFNISGVSSVIIQSCYFNDISGSSAASSFTGAAGASVAIYDTYFQSPLSIGSAESFIINSSEIDSHAEGVGITLASTASGSVNNSYLTCGSNAAVSAGAGTTMNITSCTISSSAGNAFTGSGTINYSGCTFTSTATTNASTEGYYPLTVKQGGTNQSSYGTAGQFLQTDGAGGTSWQNAATTDLHVAKFIVGKVAGQGNNYTTIAAACAAASSGDVIAIQEGTYTENFTVPAGVSLAALSAPTEFGSRVTIIGKVTIAGNSASTDTQSFSNIQFNTNGDYSVETAGGGVATFQDCFFFPNSTGAVHSATGCQLVFNNCNFDQDANAIPHFTGTNGSIFLFGCKVSSTGFSQGTNSVNSLFAFNCSLGMDISWNGTNSTNLVIENCGPDNTFQAHSITINDSAVVALNINNSHFISGGSSWLSVGAASTANVYNCTINSSAGNVITGSGVLNYGGITFSGSSGGHNVSTENPVPWPVNQGGTGDSSFTAYSVLCGGTTTTGALQNVSGVGTTGQILTSNGASALPSWQNAGAGTLSITTVNHGQSAYTVLASDEFLAVDVSGGVVTLKLPNAPTTGRVIYIKDSKGAAATSNISVTTVGGAVTIDGQTTYTMATNYQAISVVFDGTSYEVF